MSKSRFSTKEKLKLVRRYLNGEGNYHSLAYECGIDESTLRSGLVFIKIREKRVLYRVNETSLTAALLNLTVWKL